MKDLVSKITESSMDELKRESPGFYQFIEMIKEFEMSNDAIIDLIGEKLFKSHYETIEQFISNELVRTSQNVQAEKNESKSPNVDQVQRGFAGQTIENSGLKRANQYPNAFELKGNDEPQSEYSNNIWFDEGMELSDVDIRTTHEATSEAQSRCIEPVNVANTAQTYLRAISTDSGKVCEDARPDLCSDQRSLEGIEIKEHEIKEVLSIFESEICDNEEKIKALSFIRKEYGYTFKCTEYNALSSYLNITFGMSKSTWLVFIKSVELIDRLANKIKTN